MRVLWNLWLWWIWKFRYQSKCSFREEEHDARIDFQAWTVNVPCDFTSEDFDLPIEGEMKLFVLETYNNDNENCYSFLWRIWIDIAQYIYEMIALSAL
jgi:hypothetical protein